MSQAMPLTFAARRVGNLLRGFVEHARPAAADVNGRAQLRISLGHDFAEACAATRHENALALEQAVFEHVHAFS
jgi:hypothetical protein